MEIIVINMINKPSFLPDHATNFLDSEALLFKPTDQFNFFEI